MKDKKLTLSSIELKLKKKELQGKKEQVKIDRDKLVIDKIETLRNLLGETVIDEEKTSSLSEGNKYKSLLDEGERALIMDKIFELIKLL